MLLKKPILYIETKYLTLLFKYVIIYLQQKMTEKGGNSIYCTPNFKTKKALKEAFKSGDKIRVFQPNDIFGINNKIATGSHVVYLEGPHYPQPHTWYAQAKVVNGIITEIA